MKSLRRAHHGVHYRRAPCSEALADGGGGRHIDIHARARIEERRVELSERRVSSAQGPVQAGIMRRPTKGKSRRHSEADAQPLPASWAVIAPGIEKLT